MANRLAQETSPYLLQHRDNPVDWYPWGAEALARAREEDRPILLSVGYSACHWCHVMERESFEDAETAAYMNEHFVNVKVDREERPDVDAIYMEAVQAMSGQGGWPMTVFLDPDGVPFYGGTYFPPDESRGMPSFRMVMEAVVDAFERKREEIRERAPRDAGAAGRDRRRSSRPRSRPRRQLLEAGGRGACSTAPTASAAASAARRSSRPPRRWSCCWPAARRERGRARPSTRCSAGGIYDQIGGGFARYSVDAAWLVPHFEKMLYDNALLARAYLHGWQALGHERYRRVCEETLDWVLREMRGPEGGFYSALDADSEGEEGRFYVWTPAQIREVLGDGRRARRSRFYGVSERGNFEGANILHLAGGAAEPPARPRRGAPGALRGARASASGRASTTSGSPPGTRWRSRPWPRPARCSAARTTSTPPARCAEFVLGTMRDDEGRLLRTYKDGERPPQRLPRGPRLPARSAADAVRSELRAALVRRGADARRRR